MSYLYGGNWISEDMLAQRQKAELSAPKTAKPAKPAAKHSEPAPFHFPYLPDVVKNQNVIGGADWEKVAKKMFHYRVLQGQSLSKVMVFGALAIAAAAFVHVLLAVPFIFLVGYHYMWFGEYGHKFDVYGEVNAVVPNLKAYSSKK